MGVRHDALLCLGFESRACLILEERVVWGGTAAQYVVFTSPPSRSRTYSPPAVVLRSPEGSTTSSLPE